MRDLLQADKSNNVEIIFTTVLYLYHNNVV